MRDIVVKPEAPALAQVDLGVHSSRPELVRIVALMATGSRDETYVGAAGRWCYLYRAVDRDGALFDSMLSEHRDRSAARRFLRRHIEVPGCRSLRATTDRHGSYRKAIRWICDRRSIHRRDRYLTGGSISRINRRSSDTTRCLGSGTSSRRRGSVRRSMRYTITSETQARRRLLIDGVSSSPAGES